MIGAHCLLVKRAENTFVRDLANTFARDLANRMQGKAGGASCIGAENNPNNFELWNTAIKSSCYCF